ncbi:coiled-coil domain-containing protein 81-like isoform X3 [Saccostrea echinata]|uniref:coiled-coil domain-containing protein 81-like isoform X3 n=1 Tax=Saccostrea echinata TaxID=191078 RepID=UPI002A7F07ED|nr:coiled-coil domain-containing protein 81-like isoform X3 [Saccostrea echinata]
MSDPMQGILAEAKSNKYSLIKDKLSEDDVASVWENLSNFIEKHMSQQKGVSIPMLGTFTFTQKKLDIGNNKFIMMQRPIFMLSEKFAQTHGLQSVKYHVPGNIPVIQLNFAALSFESPFDRDTVETCIREILSTVSRAVSAKKNVELTFTGIGRLTVRDARVKMRFYKEFINQMDGTGKLLDSMQNRPGTVDSVMSDRVPSRPASSTTVILPKISSTSLAPGGPGALAPVAEQDEAALQMAPADVMEVNRPPIELEPFEMVPPQTDDIPTYPSQDLYKQEGMEGPETGNMATDEAIRHIEDRGLPITEETLNPINAPVAGELEGHTANEVPRRDYFDTERILPAIGEEYTKKPPVAPSRSGSRLAMPMAHATGVSLLDDLMPSNLTPKSAPSPGLLHKSSPAPFRDLADGLPQRKSVSPKLTPLQRSQSCNALDKGPEKPPSPPQSACGHPNAGQELCYLCHQRSRRNIPVSFTEERRRREVEEDKLLQQFQYMKDAEETLKDQEGMLAKRHDLQKMAAFNLGVAEGINHKKKTRDLDFHKSYIFQKRPLTPPRILKQREYASDLAGQVTVKDTVKQKKKADEEFLERLEQVQLAEDLAAQREQFIRDKYEQQDMYKNALEAQLKFKPLQVPPREPDGEVFGKNDMNNEKMADRRRRAYELFREQQELVAQKKREDILKRLMEQREEEDVLERTKKELTEDRSNRFQRRAFVRRRLEEDWAESSKRKREREMEERLHQLAPGSLLHEQCDKYNRCKQCKRKLNNCGESNIWRESRYIPGSRLMV